MRVIHDSKSKNGVRTTICKMSEEEIRAYERAKVIDEFAKKVEVWCWKHEEYNQDDLNELMDIAEQMKVGDNG